MLVCSDLHGDIAKLKAFLLYKPQEEHINLGDICDDWTASDKQIEDTIRLCFAKKSNLTNIIGNHELPYLSYPPFYCSGHREKAKKTFELVRKHQNKFKMAMYVDGFVLSHAGIDAYFRKDGMSPKDIVDYIESQWQSWLTGDRFQPFWKAQEIFWISKVSGGNSEYGGPLWARPGFDNIDKTYSQVFGHTERFDGPKLEYISDISNPKNSIIHMNMDAKRYVCFNTKTRELETFGHGMTTKEIEMFKRI